MRKSTKVINLQQAQHLKGKSRPNSRKYRSKELFKQFNDSTRHDGICFVLPWIFRYPVTHTHITFQNFENINRIFSDTAHEMWQLGLKNSKIFPFTSKFLSNESSFMHNVPLMVSLTFVQVGFNFLPMLNLKNRYSRNWYRKLVLRKIQLNVHLSRNIQELNLLKLLCILMTKTPILYVVLHVVL